MPRLKPAPSRGGHETAQPLWEGEGQPIVRSLHTPGVQPSRRFAPGIPQGKPDDGPHADSLMVNGQPRGESEHPRAGERTDREGHIRTRTGWRTAKRTFPPTLC